MSLYPLPRFYRCWSNSVVLLALLTCVTAFGGVQKDFFQGSDLNVPANYNPAGLPSNTSDVLLTTSIGALNLDAVSLNMGSLNVTANNVAYTISNNTATATGSSISFSPLAGGGNSFSGQANDAIYLGGANSILTFQGTNGGSGSGGLSLGSNSGFSVDVAQVTSTVNLSTNIAFGSGGLTKTGAGVLNLSRSMSSGSNGNLIVNGGTTNLLSGFTSGANINLAVNNSVVSPASDVTLNVQTSVQFRSLSGSVASPSSHATINLVGTGTQLSLFFAGGNFAGTIAGAGSVTVSGPTIGGQTFSGNNTYAGTTTVNGGHLRIDGATSGQGNFTVVSSGILSGSGTIGLALNGTLTLSGFSRLSAGAEDAAGTLNVSTSGTGGVIIGNQGLFFVDIGAAGASDLLAIAGGYIDLTSGSDTLQLNSLSGAFDGSTYTIATFNQNLGSGTFNTVTGLPANYAVSYQPNAIMLLPVPEPSVIALGGEILLLGWWLRSRSRKREL